MQSTHSYLSQNAKRASARKDTGLDQSLFSVQLFRLRIRVVATTPEKTHNQKFLNFETILKSQSIPRPILPRIQKKKKKKKLPPLFRVVATTPRKDPQPNISDLRDHSQSIFRPILTRIRKRKKKSCHPYILTS